MHSKIFFLSLNAHFTKTAQVRWQGYPPDMDTLQKEAQLRGDMTAESWDILISQFNRSPTPQDLPTLPLYPGWRRAPTYPGIIRPENAFVPKSPVILPGQCVRIRNTPIAPELDGAIGTVIALPMIQGGAFTVQVHETNIIVQIFPENLELCLPSFLSSGGEVQHDKLNPTVHAAPVHDGGQLGGPHTTNQAIAKDNGMSLVTMHDLLSSPGPTLNLEAGLEYCMSVVVPALWRKLFSDPMQDLSDEDARGLQLQLRTATIIDPRGLLCIQHRLKSGGRYQNSIDCVVDIRRLFRNSYRRRPPLDPFEIELAEATENFFDILLMGIPNGSQAPMSSTGATVIGSPEIMSANTIASKMMKEVTQEQTVGEDESSKVAPETAAKNDAAPAPSKNVTTAGTNHPSAVKELDFTFPVASSTTPQQVVV